jgi:serine/threonine protein kinase
LFLLPVATLSLALKVFAQGLTDSSYALLVGRLPFEAEDPETIRENIRRCCYRWPDEDNLRISADAKDLVSRLLVPAATRWTLDMIVRHPFLSDGAYLNCGHSDHGRTEELQQCCGPERDRAEYERLCQNAGIGHQSNGNPWPYLGEQEPSNTIKEKDKDDMCGLPLNWAC